MKKLFIVLFATILTSAFTNAQIKVQSDKKIAMWTTTATNHVQIGPYASPSSLCTSIGAEFRLLRYSSSNHWAYIQGRDGSGSNNIGIVFRSQYNGGLKNAMQIEPNGTVRVLINFVQPSDIRLKTGIRNLSKDEINDIYDLNAINFVPLAHDSIPQGENLGRRKFGLIAQEVQETFPDLVYEDSEGYLSISYNDFIPILLEALKVQVKRIDELESMILDMKLEKVTQIVELNSNQVMAPDNLTTTPLPQENTIQITNNPQAKSLNPSD